jgi:hypothetical protein
MEEDTWKAGAKTQSNDFTATQGRTKRVIAPQVEKQVQLSSFCSDLDGSILAVAKTVLISPGIPSKNNRQSLLSFSQRKEAHGTTTGGGSVWFTFI